jgi:hypothetical protein
VWSHVGIVCTGEAYTQVVKLTFARGASFEDPRGLFNSSLEGNMRRAIDIREGEVLDVQFDECTRTRVSGSMPPTYEVAIAATSRAELLPHGRGSIGPDHDAAPRVWAGLALVAASSPMTRR